MEALSSGAKLICGVDEVGRGPIAGPVVAAACLITLSSKISGIKDSKKLSKKRRELLFNLIITEAEDVGIGIVEPETIDKINILNASLLAMKMAVCSLNIFPDYLLVDGIYSIPISGIHQKVIIKGDDKSYTIATASIVAKVIRDRLMELYDLLYPGYNFSQNAGYPTSDHLNRVRQLGPCPIHRMTFKPFKNKHVQEINWQTR
ncbi:MAG: ribonuclease HII [bacterium]